MSAVPTLIVLCPKAVIRLVYHPRPLKASYRPSRLRRKSFKAASPVLKNIQNQGVFAVNIDSAEVRPRRRSDGLRFPLQADGL